LRVFCLSSHRKSRLEPDQKHDLDKTAVLSESGLCGQLQLNIVQCERVEERGWRGLGETGSGQLTAAMRIEPLSFMGSVRESFGDFHGQRPENRRLPAKKCGQGHFPNKKCGSCSTFLWITPAKRVPDAIRTHDLPLRRGEKWPKTFIFDYISAEHAFEWKRIFLEFISFFHLTKQIWRWTIVLKLTGT
jgi:hypothetical protein